MSMKWKTQDGRELEVSEMTDDHLINAFNLCQRYVEQHSCGFIYALYSEWGLTLFAEIRRRNLDVDVNDAMDMEIQAENKIWEER